MNQRCCDASMNERLSHERTAYLIVAQPDDSAELGFRDIVLREARPIDVASDHTFRVSLTASTLTVSVDEYERVLPGFA